MSESYLNPYQEALNRHGAGFDATLWHSRETQTIRFDVLTGFVDLSGLTNVVGGRGGDSLRFQISGGGTIDLSNLLSITGARNVRFTSDAASFNLPNLQTIEAGVLFELAAVLLFVTAEVLLLFFFLLFLALPALVTATAGDG